MNAQPAPSLMQIRAWLLVFICCLVLSGLTAIPLETELRWLARITGTFDNKELAQNSGFKHWVSKVHNGLEDTNSKYPFIAYGTHWLAFAHLVIAIAFLGAVRDPVRNIWVVQFGMIASALIIPFALGMGVIRGIPLGWRFLDCSFGLGGFIVLWICYQKIKRLEALCS